MVVTEASRPINKHAYSQSSIGLPGITATIMAAAHLLKSVDPAGTGQQPGFLQVGKHMVAFGVDVGTDVMSDLP